tara:strand:+ start:732 stop:1265 length:534 start_codon:yes stop_codon:yes gene_type:complete
MPSREEFEALGMGDFFDSMSEVTEHFKAVMSDVYWRGERLMAGKCYHLPCIDEDDAATKIKQCASFHSDFVFISPLNDWKPLGFDGVGYIASDIPVVEKLIEAHVEHGDMLFVLGPGVSFASSRTPDKLGAAIQELKLLAQRFKDNKVVIFILDPEMKEGWSDGRELIRKNVEKTLK